MTHTQFDATTADSQEAAARAIAALLTVVDSDVEFSDALIAADDPVMIRNASGWQEFVTLRYSHADIDFVLQTMDPQWERRLSEGGFSCPFVVGNWRLRITAYLVSRGAKKMLAIRRTPIKPLTLEETGLPKQVRLMVQNTHGLILIAGATGAGKSTTMAALVEEINTSRNCHIETIEDPIEFMFTAKKSIFSQREIGSDTPSFYEGVRGSMRQRPDVIVIGEIMDRPTAENAIFASESGHLVIATLHASSAHGAIQKLVSFFPGEEASKYASLATSLMGVIHQTMLPSVDGEKGVVATELLFNHNQQCSAFLSDSAKVQRSLDEAKDGVSRSLAMSLAEHVKANRVSKVDAIRSVAGQGGVGNRIQELLRGNV